MARDTIRISLASVLLGFVLGIGLYGVTGIAADKWGGVPVDGTIGGLTTPAGLWVAVTPSDSTDLPSGVSRSIYSHDGGNVVCVDRAGTALPFLLAAGEIKPLRCVRVKSTNTTSTTIYALY